MKRTYILYNKQYFDAFASAFIIWKQYKNENCLYKEYYNNQPFPMTIPIGSDVVILGLDYSRMILRSLKKMMSSVLIINNTEETEIIYDELKIDEHDKEVVIYDKNKTLCELTWDKFNPNEQYDDFIDHLIKVVENKNEENDEEFEMGISSEKRNFEVWNSLNADDVIETGKRVKKHIYNMVDNIINNKRIVKVANYLTYAINTSIYQEYISKKLMKEMNKDLILCYYDKLHKQRVFEIFTNGNINAFDIVKPYGGVGNKFQAMFTVKISSKNKI